MEAVFRAPTPRIEIGIPYPVYSDENSYTGIELSTNRKERQFVGISTALYYFCEGEAHNQLTLYDGIRILRLREWIADHPEYVEVSCDKEAEMLGGGAKEPIEKSVGIDKHAQHKAELMRKYGGDDTDTEYSEWDRKLSQMLK